MFNIFILKICPKYLSWFTSIFICFSLFFSTLYADTNSEAENRKRFQFRIDMTRYSWEELKQHYPDMFPLSHDENHYYIKTLELNKHYKTFKENNFKDFTTKDRIIYLYLHSIFDRLLESNKAFISEFFEHQKWDSIIDKHFRLFWKVDHNIGKETLAQAEEDGISIFIHELYPDFINDAYITSFLSHEIAHILLNHRQQDEDIFDELRKEYLEKYYPDLTNNDIYSNENLWSKIHQYIKSHPRYINLRRKHEIEADNLGFEIYLNAGFKAEYYVDSQLTYPFDYYSHMPFSPEIKKKLSEINNTSYTVFSDAELHQSRITHLKDFIRSLNPEEKKSFLEILNNNQYSTSTEEHANGLWRFFNLWDQEQAKRSNHDIRVINNTMVNAVYFKIDLSSLENLDEIKKFFSKKSNLRSDVSLCDNYDDPRITLAYELLKNNSQISFTLESSSKNQEIGVIRNDNTMLLRANDVFQLSYSISEVERIEKQHTNTSICALMFMGDIKNLAKMSTVVQNVETAIRSTFIQ